MITSAMEAQVTSKVTALHGPVLVICNVSKKHNVTDLIVSAYAHGFDVALVGCKKYSTEYLPAAVRDRVALQWFDTLEQCKQHLAEHSTPLWGIEIIEGAANVEGEPFSDVFALMPGNEGTGLSDKQKSLCDGFLYISQYGAGTASLNVQVATTIVMNRYHVWSSRTKGATAR